jgi:hypothetical protein
MEWMLVGVGWLKIIETSLSVFRKIKQQNLMISAVTTGTALIVVIATTQVLRKPPSIFSQAMILDDHDLKQYQHNQRVIVTLIPIAQEPKALLALSKDSTASKASSKVIAMASRSNLTTPIIDPQERVAASIVASSNYPEKELKPTNQGEHDMIELPTKSNQSSQRSLNPCIKTMYVSKSSTKALSADLKEAIPSAILTHFPLTRNELLKCSQNHDEIIIRVTLDNNMSDIEDSFGYNFGSRSKYSPQSYVSCSIRIDYQRKRDLSDFVDAIERIPHYSNEDPSATKNEYLKACSKSLGEAAKKLSHVRYEGE